MHPKEWNRLRLAQRSLLRESTTLYRELILDLVTGLEVDYPFVAPLASAWRRKDWQKVYLLSDSLSEQLYPDATSHFVANQISLLIKKYPWDPREVNLDPRATAMKTFLASEKRCGLMNRKLAFLRNNPSRDIFRKEAGKARNWILRTLSSEPNYDAISNLADCGPGASVGVTGDATSYSAKFLQRKWSVSPGALHHAFHAIKRNYHLYSSLCESRGGFVCYDDERAFAAYLEKLDVVTYNKVSFVPKTAKTERTIAVEPMLTGFYQKGIDEFLRKKLLKVGLDLRDQSLNQEMARLGSLSDDDDSFVTIDCKSASDSISIEIVRSLLPPDWFRLLSRTRSTNFLLEGMEIPYNKFCSMGNGFCFPLETLIFASACVAVSDGSPRRDFIVYGDDIIIRKRFAPRLIALLGHWGFKINKGKTFLEGPFRESCGSDWFGGEDVRPFTLDYALGSIQDIFKFLNGTSYGRRLAFFRSIRDRVVKHIPSEYRFFRPLPGPEDTGIDSTGDEHLSCPHVRYKSVGRWEWKTLVSRPLIDLESVKGCSLQSNIAMSEALRGCKSLEAGPYQGIPKVTLRRKTQTKVVRENYTATSNWLPSYG